MSVLKIAVVDDHPLFRTGVARTLAELGLEVVAEGATASEAIDIAETYSPDVMLLDISLPGNGLEAIDQILRVSPRLKVIMLTASEDGNHVRKAMQLGASGYVLKGVGSEELAEVLAVVNNGERYLPPNLTAKLITRDARAVPQDILSPREREVMDLIAIGLSNKQVARRLGLQEKTVKHHMTNILAKLNASNRTEAALRWRRSPVDA